jgi:hypothetical protein
MLPLRWMIALWSDIMSRRSGCGHKDVGLRIHYLSLLFLFFSGVIALLAAVDALSHVVGFGDLPKRLVFLVFTGEARGYLGSRQFFAQLKNGTFVDYGLTASSIQQVLEIGSVGRASQSTFFAHKQATASAAPTQQILDSLRSSASATSSTLKLANTANPGIPPSSLMTFVHNDSTIAGMHVLVRLLPECVSFLVFAGNHCCFTFVLNFLLCIGYYCCHDAPWLM